MKHGLVQGETYKGYTLMVPPSRQFYGKIGLPVYATYRFVGYKTSILRHLLDCGTETVSGSETGFTIQVRVNNVMKSATEEYVGRIQSAAFGIAGESVNAISAIGNVLDGVSFAGMVNDLLPDAERPPLKRPGKVAVKKDHIMNGRLIVDVTMHSGVKAGWNDTGQQEVTLKDIAYIVHDF